MTTMQPRARPYPIETTRLTKRYGKIVAVNDLSLRVAEGEIYAFLGLNGAGKTTTIRMLLGMIRPSAGNATVLGTRVEMGRCEPWAAVGYLVESPHAYPELTVRENLEVARRLHPGVARKAIDDVIEQLGLTAYADRRAATLSSGNAQRLGLAKAMLHRPRLLILDEPSNGLDPVGIVEIREFLRSLARDEGVTIFMSSHILGEVARLAQRIGIIHHGQLLQELDVDELKRRQRKRLLVQARNLDAARQVLVAAGHQAELDGPTTNGMARLAVSDRMAISCPDAVATLMVGAGTPPTQLLVEEEELERYFLRLIGENGKGDNA